MLVIRGHRAYADCHPFLDKGKRIKPENGLAAPRITSHYKISGILAIWPGSDKGNMKSRVRGVVFVYEKRRDRDGRTTVIVVRARKTTESRNIAEGLGEPGEHPEYPVIATKG